MTLKSSGAGKLDHGDAGRAFTASVSGRGWREGEGEQHAAPTLEYRVTRPVAPRGLGCGWWHRVTTARAAHASATVGKGRRTLGDAHGTRQCAAE
ncbi:hypothetical protein D3C75_1157460 [compost metagenome]